MLFIRKIMLFKKDYAIIKIIHPYAKAGTISRF